MEVKNLWQRLGPTGQSVAMVVIGIGFFGLVLWGSKVALDREEQVRSLIQTSLNVHAVATAQRQCAVARLQEFLALNPPTVGLEGPVLRRTRQERQVIRRLVDNACRVVNIPGDGSHEP